MIEIWNQRPDESEYPTHVTGYVAKVPAGNLLQVLTVQAEDLKWLVGSLNDEEALVRHAPYTWSIKQVVGHLADCERVFGYRTMRIARADSTPLPGFDENAYMQAVDFDSRPLAELLEEFVLQRRAHLLMLAGLVPGAWLRRGVVSDHPISARAAACVMAGHAQHHLDILHQRLGR